ncbi:Uncharacterised protein [Mycobacteroides abscessus subsp. abscessus]|nr:Uncharacterised protein [Mycobacteroides abscessus subsp. abscessus]
MIVIMIMSFLFVKRSLWMEYTTYFRLFLIHVFIINDILSPPYFRLLLLGFGLFQH